MLFPACCAGYVGHFVDPWKSATATAAGRTPRDEEEAGLLFTAVQYGQKGVDPSKLTRMIVASREG